MIFAGFFILILFQLICEALSSFLHLPLPGPVLGMFLLFVALFLIPKLYFWVSASSHFLIKRLSLFFVPAGVGIMTLSDRIKSELLPLTAILIFATLITLAVSAYAFHFARKEKSQK